MRIAGGRQVKENPREFAALHGRFTEELRPAGPLEEMLVDQIVTAHWRLGRALRAESGEIALSVDGGRWKRRPEKNMVLRLALWKLNGNPVLDMEQSVLGIEFLEIWLGEVRQAVEREGELTEAALQEVVTRFGGNPNSLTNQLERLQRMRQGEAIPAPSTMEVSEKV